MEPSVPFVMPRHTARLLNESMERRIMVLPEKHGTSYFAADTVEATVAASLLILRNWYGPNGHTPVAKLIQDTQDTRPNPPSFTGASIAALPTELRDEAKKLWQKYQQRTQEIEAKLAEYIAINMALRNNDGLHAFACLHKYYGNGSPEYWSWNFIWLTKIAGA